MFHLLNFCVSGWHRANISGWHSLAAVEGLRFSGGPKFIHNFSGDGVTQLICLVFSFSHPTLEQEIFPKVPVMIWGVLGGDAPRVRYLDEW